MPYSLKPSLMFYPVQPLPPPHTLAICVTDRSNCQSQCNSVIPNYTILYPFYREGNGTPLQYSCLENPMDRETW